MKMRILTARLVSKSGWLLILGAIILLAIGNIVSWSLFAHSHGVAEKVTNLSKVIDNVKKVSGQEQEKDLNKVVEVIRYQNSQGVSLSQVLTFLGKHRAIKEPGELPAVLGVLPAFIADSVNIQTEGDVIAAYKMLDGIEPELKAGIIENVVCLDDNEKAYLPRGVVLMAIRDTRHYDGDRLSWALLKCLSTQVMKSSSLDPPKELVDYLTTTKNFLVRESARGILSTGWTKDPSPPPAPWKASK